MKFLKFGFIINFKINFYNSFFFYKNFFFYYNLYFLNKLNLYRLDYQNKNLNNLNNFFMKIYFSNYFLKLFNYKHKFSLVFLNIKTYTVFFNKTILYKKKLFLNFFKFFFTVNFYLFSFIFMFSFKYNFNIFFFFKKIIKKKKKILNLNIFNKSLFNFFFKNYYSFLFFKNISILNLFKLNFFIFFNETFSNSILTFNNLYPVFNNQNLIFKNKFISKFKFNFDKFFNLFILNFYENLFKTNFFIKFNLNKKLSIFYKNYYKNYPFLFDNNQDNYTIDEMFQIFCFSFINRDISILNNWIINKMNKINFRNHKKFLNMIQHFLFHYKYFFIFILNIEGFFLKVKGKLSVAGNAKKKVFFYKIGKVNLSKKINKIEHSQGLIKSTYGVLGLNMFLSY